MQMTAADLAYMKGEALPNLATHPRWPCSVPPRAVTLF